MSDKAVKITLDGRVVHQCNTITEAEEWLVDDPSTDKDRVAAGDYQISADEAAVKAFEEAGHGSTTDAPEEEPINVVDALRATLANLLEKVQDSDACAYDSVADACEEAEAILADVPASDRHPMLQTFDEVVSQGRLNLIEFLDQGGTEGGIAMEEIASGLTLEDESDHPLRRPMRPEDALRLLRNRARNVTHGLGIAPLHFAVPGMTALLEELEEAVMVPSLSDYQDSDLPVMMAHAVTYDEWKHGARYVKRSVVEEDWRKRANRHAEV